MSANFDLFMFPSLKMKSLFFGADILLSNYITSKLLKPVS